MPPLLISLNSKEDSQDGNGENVDPQAELSKQMLCTFQLIIQPFNLEALKWTWHSPIYSFFKSDDISIQYHNDRLCHFFPCVAWKCKTAAGGVCCFQDPKDWDSTANLWHHVLHCFGEEVVQNGTKGKDVDETSGSIFSSFACQGQKPVHYSHWSHTNTEVQYDILLLFWCVN